jgi:hypothetical protein
MERKVLMSNLSEMDLLALDQLANATRHGVVDKGNPATYTRLAVSGYAQGDSVKGFTVTTEGLAYLSLNKHKIYGPKKREKKPKKSERYERDDADSYEDYGFGSGYE